MAHDTGVWAERLRTVREARGLTHAQLAALAGVTTSTIWRIEGGKTGPSSSSRLKLVRALGYPNEALFFTVGPGDGKSSTALVGYARGVANVEGRLDDLRSPEATPLPIYRWGACGDPRDSHSAPDPEDLEYPPIGKERLVGQHGFGVRVRGTSMVNRDIDDGDIVWINPDLPCRIGRLVLARTWDVDDSEVGMTIKVWKNNGEGGALWGDGEGEEGTNPVICSRYELIGPVVWIQPHGFEPR